ncbi:hypothetical protein NHF46_02625 [Arthrobacter alpinus]|nr:hypothetical protein [Arthrobacter alpinus]
MMPAQKNRNRLSQAAPPVPSEQITPAVVHMGGDALARELLDPLRNFTVLVISRMADADFHIDAEALAARLGDEARIIQVSNGIETRHLQDRLPAQLHIFGTGARVYPHGERWLERVPGRTCRTTSPSCRSCTKNLRTRSSLPNISSRPGPPPPPSA